MKPLNNMQLAMDIVIVAIGLSTALWVFSKAILNIILAANHWVNIPKSREAHDETKGEENYELAD